MVNTSSMTDSIKHSDIVLEKSGRKEVSIGKGLRSKGLNKDLSSSENIMAGMAGQAGNQDLGPSSPKAKSKANRKISSKNVMSSKKDIEHLQNS